MLIYGDLREATFDGFKYFLTLVDDKIRFTWIYFLRTKSDCLSIVLQFFSYVENQFQTTIRGSDLTMQKSLPFKISFQRKVSYTNFPVWNAHNKTVL